MLRTVTYNYCVTVQIKLIIISFVIRGIHSELIVIGDLRTIKKALNKIARLNILIIGFHR